jgi:hypothetical protein
MRRQGEMGGATVKVPLWMWTFSFTKHRYVPAARRAGLQAVNARLLSRSVFLPKGFSSSPGLWFRTARAADLAVQARRLSQLPSGKARLPATWEALGHALPTPVSIRVHLQSGNKGRFWLLLADSKGPLAYLERSVDFGAGVVEHIFMTRNPKRAGFGKGLGDQALANASVVYPAMGIRRIQLTAGLSSGSAIWPRLGFCPANRQEWFELRRVVMANYHKLHPDVVATFAIVHGRPLHAAITHIVADDDPEAIFDVVDIDEGQKVKHALQLKHGLSGLLLAGGHWQGHLDLGGIGGQRLEDFVKGRGLGVPSV